MEDARRFLRYVMPGLTFVILFATYAAIANTEWLAQVASKITQSNAVVALVLGFLATGGIGFLFSLIHHSLLWISPAPSDHRFVLNDLIADKKLALVDRSTGKAIEQISSARDAWPVFTALWYQRVETNDAIKSATSRTVQLADLTHTLGTTAIAGLVALIVYAVSLKYWSDVSTTSANRVLLAGGLIFVGLWWGYRRVGQFTRATMDQVFADAITEELRKPEGLPRVESRPAIPVRRAIFMFEPTFGRLRFTLSLERNLPPVVSGSRAENKRSGQ